MNLARQSTPVWLLPRRRGQLGAAGPSQAVNATGTETVSIPPSPAETLLTVNFPAIPNSTIPAQTLNISWKGGVRINAGVCLKANNCPNGDFVNFILNGTPGTITISWQWSLVKPVNAGPTTGISTLTINIPGMPVTAATVAASAAGGAAAASAQASSAAAAARTAATGATQAAGAAQQAAVSGNSAASGAALASATDSAGAAAAHAGAAQQAANTASQHAATATTALANSPSSSSSSTGTIVAIGAGAVLVGGAAWWLTRRPRRRSTR